MLFFDRLVGLMSGQFDLRVEVFLQYKVIHPALLNSFLATTREFSPITGLGRRPGATIPECPSAEEMNRILEGGKFDIRDHLADYTYWFLEKADHRQRDLFLGHGGLTLAFLKPDPKTMAPKLMVAEGLRKHPASKMVDIEKVYARSFGLMDGFLAKSKELFGAGLENNPQFPGLPFILPLWCTGDFFSLPEEERAKCFELFDVYITESPADKGLLLATKKDYEEKLIGLLQQMREQGSVYPER